jgi:SSS family solute:Na+ symporter
MDPYAYQYTVGGIVFAVGLFYAKRQGYVGLSGRGARNLLILLFGLTFFMVLQGYLQFASMQTRPAIPFHGEPLEEGNIGTSLDYGVMIGYFIAILAIGTFFGRGQKTTKDFFFAGQRFSWWLIAFSLVATTVGSYSFVKYSSVAYTYGLSSSQTYLNDWFWVPLFVFGWLPILYFSKIQSIPEYFEKRFGSTSRKIVTFLLLTYLIGYVGVNLFTMGKALNILLGWDIRLAAVLVASISAFYVTLGGQTSVIMTDLFQGMMLLATGFVILWLGIDYLGDFSTLWEHLPRENRAAFSPFNEHASFPAVGIFWQDAMANTAMFYFLNQGILMRFMSAKSVNEGRKAAYIVPMVLMPLAAIAVASGGWVGRALEHAGVLPSGMEPSEVFFITAEFLSQPGIFGLILAALTAALMSTVDTLITAVAAITVNDIYKPYIRPNADDAELVKVARFSSVGVALIGLALVPLFMTFDSIYAAHGAFTAAVTPPMVVALFLSVFWRRFTAKAAVWTLLGGSAALIASVIWPELVSPFSHGIEAHASGGAKAFKFTRALYGLAISGTIGVVVTFFTRPEPVERQVGLVWGTMQEALNRFKGGEGREVFDKKALARCVRIETEQVRDGSDLLLVDLSTGLAEKLDAKSGDIVYVSDKRRWLGGLRSTHAVVGQVREDLDGLTVELGPTAFDAVAGAKRAQKPVRIERLY